MASTNFMRKFRDENQELKTLTAYQFMDVWNHYDKDGNGFIEGKELDSFLQELISSVNQGDVGPEAVSDTALSEFKKNILDAFDENEDGKLDMLELAQIMPMEQNFLLLFRRDNPLSSSVEFMKIWKKYDKDNSGFIEADELKHFIRDLLDASGSNQEVTEETIIEYADTMLHIFDENKDGKLQLSEMAKLLPVRENFLMRPIFKGASLLSAADIDRVFNLYDQDHNEVIEGDELDGFLKDLLELAKSDYDAVDLGEFRQVIMRTCDLNHDGKISKSELKMVLLAMAKSHEKP